MTDEVMEKANTEAAAPAETQEKEVVFTKQQFDKAQADLRYKMLRSFEEKLGGVDVEAAVQALREKEEAEIERQKERGEFEAILKKTIEKKDAEIQSYRNKLHSTLVEGQLLAEANRNNAVSAEQVSSLLRNNLRLAEDGHVEVLDANGSPRYNDAGDPLSVGELVSEFLTVNPHFVRATPGGTGSQGKAGGSTQKPASVADMLANWDQGGKKAYAEYMKANK